MLSLVRSGPKILVLGSNHVHEIISYCKKMFEGYVCDIDTAFEKSNDQFTIVLLTEKSKQILHLTDIENILVLKENIENILNKMLNDKMYDKISYSRIAPRIIVMRCFGNTQKILDQIKEDHYGSIGTFHKMLEEHNHGVVIVFTTKPLHKPIGLCDLYDKSLFIQQNYPSLIQDLRIHSLKYLNIGLDNKDWYELHIKIYDSYGEYLLHYERLFKVMEDLELGLILGESWGTDAATIFYSVGIYRIRFFTFYEPKVIKKILLGLEYLEDGTRIVDLDLYHKRKKIHWSDVREKNIKDKITLSNKFRKEIFSNLKQETCNQVLVLEEKIKNTRY
ncbi:hypothetical protein [Inediibacterium massiliense]|uniref:hypothetical protein n=1 Tax=Inediibacterium massiliense TaxID=1658111 RepID=UPI0006B5E80C|nr:hypothetical protein [Inediibacterium massiliense]